MITMTKIKEASIDHSISSHKNALIENKTDDKSSSEFKAILDRYDGMSNPIPLTEKKGRLFILQTESQILNLEHWNEKNFFFSQCFVIEQGIKRTIGSTIKNKDPITVNIDTRDKKLKDIITKATEIDAVIIENFLSGIVEVAIYLENHDTLFRDIKPVINETNPINGFEDYDEDLRNEANEIFNDDPLKFFVDAFGTEHYGDENNKELLTLVYFAKHVKNGKPVHVSIVGSPDSGKTSLANKTIKIVPDRFRFPMNTMSSKALYYHHNDLREDHNHILINDVLDSPESIGTLKAITDTQIDNPTHRTVSDKKEAVKLEITGKNTVILTVAQQITDRELNRRLLRINPDESEEHQIKAKESIAENEAGIGSNSYNPIFDVCKAVYDKIIETEYNVFVPWLTIINTNLFSNTDFKHFSNLVKARALIYQSKRIKIGNNTILASLDDIEEVLRLWKDIQRMQKTYLPSKAFEMLDLLPEIDTKKFETELHYGKKISEIVKEMKQGKSTINRWIFGDEDFKGLNDLGLVEVMQDGNGKTAPYILYRNKIDGDKEALPLTHSDMNKQIRKSSSQRKMTKSVCDFFIDNEIHDATEKNKLFESVSNKVKDMIETDEDIPSLYQLAKIEYENFL